MQDVVFGIMIMNEHVIFVIGFFFEKIDLGNYVMKDKFLCYKFIGDILFI
jgi:hypothetical protein